MKRGVTLSRPGSRRRVGFTVLELLVVMTLIGILMTFAYPRYRTAMQQEATIGARSEVVAQLSRARTTAAQRGCRTQLHFDSDEERVWVTACKTTGSGIDTIGTMSSLDGRYLVDFTASADSIGFGPTGIGLASTPIDLSFERDGRTSTLSISSVGRPTW